MVLKECWCFREEYLEGCGGVLTGGWQACPPPPSLDLGSLESKCCLSGGLQLSLVRRRCMNYSGMSFSAVWGWVIGGLWLCCPFWNIILCIWGLLAYRKEIQVYAGNQIQLCDSEQWLLLSADQEILGPIVSHFLLLRTGQTPKIPSLQQSSQGKDSCGRSP